MILLISYIIGFFTSIHILFFKIFFTLKYYKISLAKDLPLLLIFLVQLVITPTIHGFISALTIYLVFVNFAYFPKFNFNLQLKHFLYLEIILMVFQKFIFFKSDYSGGLSDTKNSSGVFSVLGIIFLIYSFKNYKYFNKIEKIYMIIFLVLGTIFSEAKIIIFILPFLVFYFFRSKISVFKLTLYLLIFILSASSIDLLISWSNGSESSYILNFVSDPSILFERQTDSNYYEKLVVEGESADYKWSRFNTVKYFFLESSYLNILFGYQLGSISKSIFGFGSLFSLGFFRTFLSFLLFNLGLFGTFIFFYLIFRRSNILKVVIILFISFYTSALSTFIFSMVFISFNKKTRPLL